MSAEVTNKVSSVLSEYIAPLLKAHDFRKSGQRFWHRRPDCIWVFEIQRGKYNHGSRGEFTANLGAYHPGWVDAAISIPRLQFMGPVTDKPAEQNCFLRERLDELVFADAGLDDSGGGWWKVSPQVSAAELGAPMTKAIEQYALPWFERFSDLEVAVNFLDQEYAGKRNAWFQKVAAMCGQALIGNVSRATALYAAALSDSPDRGKMVHAFANWRTVHGISAPS